MSRFPLPSNDSDIAVGLKPPQYGVRTILAITTIVALVIVSWRSWGPVSAAVEVLFLMAVLAHVVGNSLGVRLRDQGRKPASDTRESARPLLHANDFAPETQLAVKKGLGRTLPIISCFGGMLGGAIGGNWLVRLNADQISRGSSVLAYASCGVLGGFLGFMAYSFAKVFFQALWQAHRHDN